MSDMAYLAHLNRHMSVCNRIIFPLQNNLSTAQCIRSKVARLNKGP